jgi:carbonic anhydrase
MINIKSLIYLLIILVIIGLLYSCYHYRVKDKNENFKTNKVYEIPNQLTSHTAKALVLSCMDFRLIDDEVYYFNKIGYTNNYDKFVLAGASLGYNQTSFPEWKQSFNKHIELAIRLHQIDEIIVLEHMGCGAYKILYNNDSLSKDEEFKLHKLNANKFKQYINSKFPTLKVSALIMDLNGSVIQL